MKIATINVNGIRAAFRKGMGQWLENHDADILCLQEVRATSTDAVNLLGPAWDTRVWECRIKGRAGVALALRRETGFSFAEVSAGLPAEMYLDGVEPDVDSGRWLEASLRTPAGHTVRVISSYLHAGALGTERQDQKMAYLQRITSRIRQLAAVVENSGAVPSAEAVICGDFNVVRTARDIKNWKTNHNKSSGVLDEEIAFLDNWMADTLTGSQGKPYVDVIRALSGDAQGPYTWWSQRGQAFDNDAGWRIDYHMATPGLASRASSLEVWRAPSYEARFTDHAPVTVAYDFS